MNAKEWFGVMKQADDYNPAMTNLIEKYGELLSAEKDTQLKDLLQQLSSLKASMDILVDDNERLSKRGMRWMKASEKPKEDSRAYWCKVKMRQFALPFTEKREIFYHNGRFSLNASQEMVIEWLDESESIIPKGEEWVAYGKLKPEVNRWVLFTWEGNEVPIICCFKGNDTALDALNSCWEIDDTYFWMPPPIPPQEEEIKK